MLKQIYIILFISVASVYAQIENYNAPVKWERYKASESEVSILFPKLPTFVAGSNVCRQADTNNYTAYAENVVYGLNVVVKSTKKIPGYCTDGKKFDEDNFTDRIRGIKSELNTKEETKINQNGMEVTKIENKLFSYWLINDFKNKRYFELWATETDETNVNIKNFVKSFKIENNPSGIEIGKGAHRTLGDETSSVEPATKKSTGNENEDVKMRVIVKPKASYTDMARQKNVEGVVQLRLTFLASGGIGSISTIKTLPYGLTEQAIAAAAKIAFVPANRNGVPISIARIVEYSFSIY